MSTSSSTVSVIVSPFRFGKPLEQCLGKLERTCPAGTEILSARESPNRAVALNRAVQASHGDILVFIPSFIDVDPSLIRSYLALFDQEPETGIVYGDYTIVFRSGTTQRRTVLANEADLSEWSSVGYVTAVRRSAFLQVDGYDSSFRSAEEYDLRLRITSSYRLAKVAEPLYTLDQNSVPFDQEPVKEALRRFFTPESSPQPGLGYLFCRAEISQEIARAFGRALGARNACLEGEIAPVRCPHHDRSPVVSVLMPVYNRAAYVTRALESVRGGTFRDFEIIVVDGGSTDGTVDEIAKFQRRLSTVTLLHNPGRLVATSLNIGLRAARGKYVAQLDSDDEYTPATLERTVAHLEANPDCALALSYYDFIDPQGRTLSDLGVITHAEYDRNTIMRTNGAGHVRMWHRCVLERLGGFDERRFPDYAEDYDLILRLSERYAVGRVPEVLYHWRQHSSNSGQCLSVEYRARTKALARALALERRAGLNGDRDAMRARK